MREVRTRFAPSPTGYLHVGGARTAFFSWLLAKHFGGKFLLRVEDTDQERLVPGAIKSLIEELSWFGIQIDEGPALDELRRVGEPVEGIPEMGGPYGPYIQSLRLPRYREVAEDLISRGVAYRCDCTPAMLEKERLEQMARRELPGYTGYCRDRNVSPDAPHVVRFRMPHKREVVLMDAVKGRVVWDSIPLRDTVLLKSGGFPTYHLAVVVDDHDMKISHVLRGDEWLSTAPLHLLLYEALGWEAPVFAHLPVIKGPNGKKLSKRDGSVYSSVFREQGYLAEALLNFVVLIGWSAGAGIEQEIFTRAELVTRFTLEGVNSASGIFDYHKLSWMNGVYIRNLPLESFMSRAREFVERAGLPYDEATFRPLAAHVQERVKTLTEVAPMVEFLFKSEIDRDLSALYGKEIDQALARRILEMGLERIKPITEFSVAYLEAGLRGIPEELKLKVGPVFGVFRVAVTGKKVTPPLFESLVALGKEMTIRRLEETVQLISTGDSHEL